MQDQIVTYVSYNSYETTSVKFFCQMYNSGFSEYRGLHTLSQEDSTQAL